jgi:AAA domain
VTQAVSLTDVINAAMEAVRSHPADIVILAPPGAGKTSLLIELIVLTAMILGRTVLVAAVSNDQCDDITRRAAAMYPRLRIDRFVATNETRSHLAGLLNVRVVDATSDLTSQVVVATVAKFGEIKDLGYLADQLFIDEAYQARRADYDRIRALARKACLIGDPGQIRPIYRSDIRLYAADPCGPHVAAPLVLLNNGTVVRLQMGHSRRLPQDTIDVVQPSFYPALPFAALAGPGQRAITGGLAGMTPPDCLLDRALVKGSLSMVALPSRIVPRFDSEVLDLVAGLVDRLVQRQFQFVDDADSGVLAEKDIGVVAFHRDEVTAIRRAVGPGVYVETANRFQGLERRVIVALHPMSGAERLTEFNGEAGRACVALSRHRIACLIVGRDGISEALDRAVLEDERHLGRPDDPLYDGMRAHRTLMEQLEARGLIERP